MSIYAIGDLHLSFDNSKPIPYKQLPNLKESGNTYIAKIKPLSDFMGIK